MRSILLDTNVVSELMRPEPDRAVLEWFEQREDSDFYVSAVVQAEIMLGIALLPAGKRRDALAMAAEETFSKEFAGRCLPFDAACVAYYAGIVASRHRAGFRMTSEDAQIAAIALSHGYALATRNTKDFMQIDGLQMYNPWRRE